VDLTLYAVGASGRVNLGDLAKDIKFFTIENDPLNYPDGTLILTPVNVVSASGKRAATDEDDAQG
jgi:hypothetical protein